MSFTEIENYLGAELPQEYKDALKNKSEYKIEYKDWVLFSEEELNREINLSGNKMPYYKILEGHYNDSEGFSFRNKAKLKRAVAISDENSDILFFDTNLHIYIFFLSSMEVIKIANSFRALKKYKVEPEVFEDADTLQIFGKWIPVSSSTHKMSLVKDIFPSYEFNADGTGRIIYDDEIDDIKWKTIENKKDFRQCILIDKDEKKFISEITDNSFLYSNKDNDLKITYKKVD